MMRWRWRGGGIIVEGVFCAYMVVTKAFLGAGLGSYPRVEYFTRRLSLFSGWILVLISWQTDLYRVDSSLINTLVNVNLSSIPIECILTHYFSITNLFASCCSRIHGRESRLVIKLRELSLGKSLPQSAPNHSSQTLDVSLNL